MQNALWSPAMQSASKAPGLAEGWISTAMTSPERARWATFAIFLSHGLLVGAWVPHIPLAKDRLAVGPAVLGLALLALAGGAVLAMPVTGALINRFGSAVVTATAGPLLCLAFLAPIFAPTLPYFVIGIAAMGMTMGCLDVAMNAHGIAVERALKRPTMSMFHAGWSIGSLSGAFLGAAALHNWGQHGQAIAASGLCLALIAKSIPKLMPAGADRGLSGSHFAWPTRATIGLGLLAFLALMIEGSVRDWAAILMRDKFMVTAGYAALAFGFYQTGLALIRLTGDRLRVKLGATRLLTVSALLSAAGTAIALAAPTPAIAMVAFVLAGMGIGNLVPVLFAGGGRLEPDAPGRGIAAVTTMGYTGYLAGPPLIGFAAELTSLPLALGLTVVAALIIAFYARVADAADAY